MAAVALIAALVAVAIGLDAPALDLRIEMACKLALTLAVLAALLTTELRPLRRSRWRIGLVCGAAALVSLFAFSNFGQLHAPHFVHYWEQFHYQLGSKYFPELGHDGLYVASLLAQAESAPERPPQSTIRDLRVNRVVAWRSLVPHVREVRARFSPERWESFVADNDVFVRADPANHLDIIRLDHGYNSTPAWTFVARSLNGRIRLNPAALAWLAGIDLVLLAIAMAIVFRTYGTRTGWLCLVILGLGYAGRFAWLGGAYLRLDWLAAVLVAICMLRRGHAGFAGALIGYAAAVRLFPAALLIGPVFVAARELHQGLRPRWVVRLGAGFLAAIALGFVAGGFAGRGFGAWGEFAERMGTYRLSAARNAIGLENLVLYGGEILVRAVRSPSEKWPLQREDVVARRAARLPLVVAAAVSLLALLGAACWRARPDRAAALGMLAFFALTPAAGYYWILLMAVPLARDRRAVYLLLGVNVFAYAVHLAVADNLVRYGVLSWALLLFFVAWTAPAAWRTLGGSR